MRGVWRRLWGLAETLAVIGIFALALIMVALALAADLGFRWGCW